MKIAYVLVEEFHPGLQNKIFGQVQEWEACGHEVVFVAPKTGRVFLSHGDLLFEDSVIADRDHGQLVRRNRFTRLNLLRRQYAFLKRALEEVKPDLSYGRYPFPYWGVTDAYSAGQPFVFEINSNDLTEYYLKHRTTGVYNQLFRKAVLKKAAGMVFVTAELAESKAFSWYSGPKLILGNGVNVSAFPYIEETGNEKPNLCFIGSPNQKWHGLGHLDSLATQLHECVIHVVGPDQKEYLDSGGKIHSNMVFHGYLQDIEAKKIVAKMDVGIATLALYEKSMNEACTLKARQYLAQGLPVIGAYTDTDIQDQPFYLELPNCSDNILLGRGAIADFVSRSFRNRALREQARSFAERVLDVGQKEQKRLEFFREITCV